MKTHKELLTALLAGKVVITESGGEAYLNKEGMLETKRCISYIMIDMSKGWKLKPKMININGIEVPEPCRKPLEVNTVFYIPNMLEGVVSELVWMGLELDHRFLERGLVHLHESAAKKHLAALLSFTEL